MAETVNQDITQLNDATLLNSTVFVVANNGAAYKTTLDALRTYLNEFVDSVPTSESTRTVSSGGVFSALQDKQNLLTFDNSPTENSNNPVKSGGVKTALDTLYITAGKKTGTTLGNKATAEGNDNTASNDNSHAEGMSTVASGYSSHAEGHGTISQCMCQHVFGAYNVADANTPNARGTYVEMVGNGSDNSNRSNARTLDWLGNETLAGKLTLGTAPTSNMDAATKKYVDDAIATAISNAIGGSY